MDWINLDQERDKRLDPVNTFVDSQFTPNTETFFSSWHNMSSQKMAVLHGADMMLCRLVYLSALVLFLDIRYFSAFFLPLFFQLSFTFCLHIPSSFGTKQQRMSPTLASSCIVNFMDVIMDAWRRQWAMILFPLGLLDRTVLDIQLPKSEIINSCWPVEWPLMSLNWYHETLRTTRQCIVKGRHVRKWVH